MSCQFITLNRFKNKLPFNYSAKLETVFIFLQNAVGGWCWWLMQQLEKKVVSGKVQTPSHPNSPTCSLSLSKIHLLTQTLTFTFSNPLIASLSHPNFSILSLNQILPLSLFSLNILINISNTSDAHSTLPLFHFHMFKSSL